MARDAGLDLIEHRRSGNDLPGRAVAALIAVMFDEGLLQRVKVVGGTEVLDGGNVVAFMHHGEREA